MALSLNDQRRRPTSSKVQSVVNAPSRQRALLCLNEEQSMPLITRNHPKLTLEGARTIVAAAERRAVEINVPMNIAVVDDGGHLLAFSRMDGAKLSSIRIAMNKAHSAAIRRKPSGPAMAPNGQPDVMLSVS